MSSAFPPGTDDRDGGDAGADSHAVCQWARLGSAAAFGDCGDRWFDYLYSAHLGGVANAV